MSLDAVIADLQHDNTVLLASAAVAFVCVAVAWMIVCWLEAELEKRKENGCAHCSHCAYEAKLRAEHRQGKHEMDCSCLRGGPPRPKA